MSTLPHLKDAFSQLISTPSISALEPEHDMSNHAVIGLLQNWFSELGFSCETPIVTDSRNK